MFKNMIFKGQEKQTLLRSFRCRLLLPEQVVVRRSWLRGLEIPNYLHQTSEPHKNKLKSYPPVMKSSYKASPLPARLKPWIYSIFRCCLPSWPPNLIVVQEFLCPLRWLQNDFSFMEPTVSPSWGRFPWDLTRYWSKSSLWDPKPKMMLSFPLPVHF